jgi:hypothetical protein
VFSVAVLVFAITILKNKNKKYNNLDFFVIYG